MYQANSAKIMRPWIPVTANEQDNTCEVQVWGRTYTAASSCMLSSVVSQKRELLAAPIRIVGTDNGRDICFTDAKCFLMDEVTKESAAFCCAAEA